MLICKGILFSANIVKHNYYLYGKTIEVAVLLILYKIFVNDEG